jgi:hypothetical protein
MIFEIKKILAPGKGVDLVFNMDDPVPISRSTIIFDADFDNNTITVAQPFVPLSPKTKFNTLHVTGVIPGKHKHLRVGSACRVLEFIDHYALAGGSEAKAIVLQCDAQLFETNIRAAFRLPLGRRHFVTAKLHYAETYFFTDTDFKIRDISFAGIGILVPKLLDDKINPLTRLEQNDTLVMDLALVDTDQQSPIGNISVNVEIKRIHKNYSELHNLVGLKIVQISRFNENLLNKFIHDAQIAELKRFSVLR